MTCTTLIFDRDHVLIGEVATTSGCLDHILLTERGEKIFGDKLQSWIMHGIPKLCQKKRSARGTDSAALFHTLIKTRQPEFAQVFQTWLKWHGLACITLYGEALDCWHRSLCLPLESNERFAICTGLSCANEELSKWKEALAKAEKTVDEASVKQRRLKKKDLRR